MPASRDGLGPFYQDVIAVSPLEPWDAASAAYRLEILARTLPFPVGGGGDSPAAHLAALDRRPAATPRRGPALENLDDWNTRMERMETIAFIGLGIMGSPMARRLLAAGYPLTVWNRTASRAEPLRAEGATVAASPAEAVREADVVITMLADPTAVREVIGAIARHLRPGTTVIEASTIGPQALGEVAALLPGSVALVDAPVMGSADRAASGQLVVLAGGDLTKVRPILEVFGTVTECGAVGHGAALKVVLINAVIAGVTVVGEAMALGDAFGLPEELVTGALANGPLAGIAGRAFAQGANYPLRLAAKDVTLATATADLPLLRIVHDWLIAFPEAGSEDLGQIVRHIRAQRQA